VTAGCSAAHAVIDACQFVLSNHSKLRIWRAFLFNVLGMVAEFESDLIRLRTRRGMKVAEGRPRGKQLKLKPTQAKHPLDLHDSGSHTQAELAELFGVGRSTVYRTIERMRPSRQSRSGHLHLWPILE
jgi:DNA invertase Pin-like site-specific DNA recombinase